MKYYYLINNRIMSANEKMLKIHYNHTDYNQIMMTWKRSLQPCEISEGELEEIYRYLLTKYGIDSDEILNPTPIEVTDIVEENDIPTRTIDNIQVYGKTIIFKQTKQVEEIEAVELIKYLDECIESCNKRLNEFKTGKMDYSYYGSMAMMSAYNNVKQFIKEQNNETK